MTRSQKLAKTELDPYFEQWEKLRAKLQEQYRQRDRNAAVLMKEAIAVYETILGKCTPFPVRPLNGEERLGFVKANPASFAAFRQLAELFSELGKRIAAERVKKDN